MEPIIIVGCGGLGLMTAELLESTEEFFIHGFVDDKYSKDSYIGYPYLGDLNWLMKNSKAHSNVVIALGSSEHRLNVYDKIKGSKFNYPILIHPSVTMSKRCEVGRGTIILPGCVICGRSKIGEFSFLNCGSIIEHDVIVESFSSLALGSIVKSFTTFFQK